MPGSRASASATPTPSQRIVRERALSALASRQWGIVSRRQLTALGFGDDAIWRRVRDGRLHRVHQGIYSVGHAVVGRQGRWLAAVLACGDGAALSHRSGAHLWELRSSSPARPEVSRDGGGRRSRPGLLLYQPDRPLAGEVTLRSGIPVTTVERTLADLAGVLAPRSLERTIARAEAMRLLDVPTLLDAVAHRPGAPAVRRILADWVPSLTRSELEDRMLDLLDAAGLPRPEVNARVGRFEVDLVWRAARLVAETDGHAFHGSRRQVERDRHRDAVLTAAGYRVLRFTWKQVVDRPDEVVRAVATALTH